jgi:short-subunit dehydrogenase
VKLENGTVVVVTGASGGVGRATARLIAERGATVALLARGSDGLEGAKRDVEKRGGRALAIQTDVADFDQVREATKKIEREAGPIALWINNAMLSMYSPFIKMTPDEFKRIVEVTFLGAVYGTHCALESMLSRDRGAIIQVGSALAFRSIPLQSAYCASKHAIHGFTESVRSELIHNRSNVHLCLVNLPALNTTQFIWTRNKMPRKARPTGTIYQPEVAARAIVFAAEHKRRELMVGYTTVEATVGEKFIPGLLDHYLATAAWEGSLLPEAAQTDKPDNFWKPLSGDHGAHGPFDHVSKRSSWQLWATENRAKIVTALLIAGFCLASIWARERA